MARTALGATPSTASTMGSQENFGTFIIAGSNGAVLFESGQEMLDQMPRFIYSKVTGESPADAP
jgi:hypothetical protein